MAAGDLSDSSDFFPATRAALIRHLAEHGLRTDGPFLLRSGIESDWYMDARQTTYDGEGMVLVSRCVLEIMNEHATAIGGMTMGADPIAVGTAAVGALQGRRLKAFSVRKTAKDHGTGGRIVGPVVRGDRAVVVDDTVTTGGALVETVAVLRDAGIGVVQAVAVVDRSGGDALARLSEANVPFSALVEPADLGLEP